MRVSVTIETEGVITEVSRDYEPGIIEERTLDGKVIHIAETPNLATVAKNVAAGAVHAHQISNT